MTHPLRPTVPLCLPGLLGLLLAAAPALPAQQPADGTRLRIGTWNLEFYGHRRDPRTEADHLRIAAQIRALGVAVLAVQEIGGDEVLGRLAQRIGPAWQAVLGTTGGFREDPHRLAVGFLYDGARVELLAAEELLEFPRRLEDLPIFHRVPVTACFRDRATGFDFRAVTVHLKAGREPADDDKRRLEATVLGGWLARLQDGAGEDPDLVLLGDCNATYDSEPLALLERGGRLRPLRAAAPEPTILHFEEPIDMIAVGAGLGEAVAATFDSHQELAGSGEPSRTAWRQTYSDHFPVTVDLAVRGDDDPGATFATGPQSQWLPVARRTGRPQATADAPAGAGAQEPAAPAEPMPPGARVRVHLAGGSVIEGLLLAPLGDWVYVRTGRGETVACAREHVVTVTRP